MPILELQKRARELGRIRIGQVVPTQTGRTRPEKLDRFRLTSSSKALLDKVAGLYGGEVREWQPQGGGAKAWEVVTESRRIPILVPPQPITQWLEFWTGGGCKRRCDGETEQLSDQPCICKANADASDGPTDLLCKPTTRLNVVLRDVEGIGVWRLETHGWNAATELPDVAGFLAQAGGYVDGFLALEERTSKAEVTRNGETKVETRHFMVPTIEVDVTPAELLAGKGRIQAPQMEGPVSRRQLEASKSAPADAGTEDTVLARHYGDLKAATTTGEVADIYARAKESKHLGSAHTNSVEEADQLFKAIGDRHRELSAKESQEPVQGQVVDGDVDPEEVWRQIVAKAGSLTPPMTTQEVHEDFAKQSGGVPADQASGAELTAYLAKLQERAA